MLAAGKEDGARLGSSLELGLVEKALGVMGAGFVAHRLCGKCPSPGTELRGLRSAEPARKARKGSGSKTHS